MNTAKPYVGTLTQKDIEKIEAEILSDTSEKWLFPKNEICSIPKLINDMPKLRKLWLVIFGTLHGYKVVV